MNQGRSFDFVLQLAELKPFKKFGINPKRANDQDFIVRFIAFYLHRPADYSPDLEAFLNVAMKEISELTEKKLDSIKSNFIQAMKTAWAIFDNDAFRKRYTEKEGRKPINKSLFEAWSVTLARCDERQRNILIERKESVNNMCIELLNSDKEFENSISSGTGKISMVIKRHKAIQELVEQVCND